MKHRSQRLAGLITAALIPALLASGCGRGSEPDLVAGKDLFTQKCGSCHTLKRAATKGTQGPNLDEAFGPAKRHGLGDSTVEGVVRDQIALTRRSSIMKPNLVTGQDANDVAAYVGMVAGESGKDAGALASAGQPKVSSKPIAAKGGKLEMPADPSGGLAFASTKATAMAGMLELISVNKASIPHNIAVRDSGGKLLGEGPDVQGGKSSTVSVTVKPGKYEFVCTVPGHEDGGMKGELEVK